MPKKFSLAKNERLKSRKLIDQVFTEGKSFVVGSYRVYYLRDNKQIPGRLSLQFGVGVSAKHFKKAVDRNRIKRLTRETYRLKNTELKKILAVSNQQLSVFFIYTSKELPVFRIVQEEVEVVLDRIIKIVNESNSSNS